MGRRLNLSHLSEEECERVLQVIQRDFDLRQKEKDRLGKIEEEIKEEDTKTQILAKEPKFNENCCMRCFSRFMFIFNQKVECKWCKYFICKDCSEYDKEEKQYVCKVCLKQRDLEQQSFDWFYNNVKRRFKRFGSAKVVRSLYKRKTDSDSENDSGYDPSLYSNSLPVGKRSRQSLQGLFANLNSDVVAARKERSGIPLGEHNEDEEGSDTALENAAVNATFQTAYTCTVPSNRDKFHPIAQDVEVQTFKDRLNGIVDDIHRTLENQSPQGSPREDTRTEYERILDNHRLNLSTALNKLTQKLHLAIDDQTATSDDLPSPTTKHHMVKQLVVKEVEQYVGRSIDVGDEVTSEYASEDGSTSDIQNQKPYEDVLADSIVKMILDDHYRHDTERHLVAEVNVRNDLTRLSNKCTLEQLNDMMSESETDDVMSSTRTSLHLETDGESPLSEADPDGEVTVCAPERDRLDFADSDTVTPSSVAPLNYSDDDLDDLLLSNASDKDWERLGIKKPIGKESVGCVNSSKGLVDHGHLKTSVDGVDSGKNVHSEGDKVTRYDSNETHSHILQSSHGFDSNENKVGEMTTNSVRELSPDEEIVELRQIAQEAAATKAVAIPRGFVEKVEVSPPSDSDDTLEAHSTSASPVEETLILKRQAMRDNAMPEMEDEDVAFEFAQRHEVPLPSFSDDGNDLGRQEVDLDDISRKGDEEDLGEREMVDTEISFGSNWSLGGSLFKDRSFISAYDNFGERKVGKDVEGPVMMLIPTVGEVPPSPRIGDRDVDELSDLSENNNSNSEDLLSSGSESDEYDLEEEEEGSKRARALHRADSSVQTDENDLSGGGKRMLEANIQHEYIAPALSTMTKTTGKETYVVPPTEEELKQKREERLSAALSEDEDENDVSDDGDPKFIERPKSVTVTAGELARFECQAAGSEPLDVFWYRDTTDICQLDSNEHYEVYFKNGRHYLEVFNTTKEDIGQYLCIAVNEVGRCSRRFRLRLSDGGNEQRAPPEFLKDISDAEVLEGGLASFRCKLKGYPQPRVLWYKDGKRLLPSSLVHTEKIGNRDYVLTLDSVTLDDDAEYTVVARNIAGEARSSAQLIVEPRPEGAVGTETGPAPAQELETSLPPKKKKIYPDTEELLKIAERVSAANTRVTDTAENVLHSADQLSSIHRQLDEMDRKLNHMEDEVHDSLSPQADSVISEDDNISESTRDSILKEHQEMQSAARSVRQITSTALEVLSSAQDVIQAERIPTVSVEAVEGKPQYAPGWEEKKPEEEDHLTYTEFEKLYELGKVTREQIRTGKFSPREIRHLRSILEEEYVLTAEDNSSLDIPDDLSLINCGPKRVNSKRYKRDYVINRSPQVGRKSEVRHWEVKVPSSEGTEIIKATSASDEEDLDDTEEETYPLQSDVIMEEDETEQANDWKKDTNSTEDEIYMTASKVYSLEERIRQLEGQVQEADEDPETLSDLEDQVARAAAMVTQSDQQVTKIEQRVSDLEYDVAGHIERTPSWRSRSDNQSELKTDEDNNCSLQGDTFSESLSLNLDQSEFELDFTSEFCDSINQNSSIKSLRGSTCQDEVPESRSEFDDNLEMPSVKRLRSKFKGADESLSVKRVSSLTGRDLPRTVREKLRNQSTNVVPSSNVRGPPSGSKVQRPGVMSLFDDSELRVVENPDAGAEPCVKPSTLRLRTSTPVWDVSSSSVDPSPIRTVDHKLLSPISSQNTPDVSRGHSITRQPVRVDSTSKNESSIATGKSPQRKINTSVALESEQPSVKGAITTRTEQMPYKQVATLHLKQPAIRKDSPSLQVAPSGAQAKPALAPGKSKSSDADKNSYGKRSKSSAIMARAAYWDSRINDGKVSDTEVQLKSEFPELPGDSFKSSSDA